MKEIRVLLVDDNEKFRNLYTIPDVLDDNIIVTPSNEFQATSLLKQALEDQAPFDVLLLDAYFSTSGRGFISFIKGWEPLYSAFERIQYPSVILFSGLEREAGLRLSQEIARKTRFENTFFLQKPASQDELRNAILRTLENKPLALSPTTINAPIVEEREATLEDVLTSFADFRRSVVSLEESVATAKQTEHVFKQSLLAMPPEEMLRPYRETVSISAEDAPLFSPCEFADAVGASLAGRLAFTFADIRKLRANDSQTPIILATPNGGAETIEMLALVDGVIVVGERAAHFRQIAGAMDKSCLMMNADVAKARGVTLHDGALVLEQGKTTQYCGSFVTIDAHHKMLYACEHSVVPAIATNLYMEFTNYADKLLSHIRKTEGATIHNSPAAFSTQVDFLEDARSCPKRVGLSRVENYYLSTEGRDVLTQAILTPTVQSMERIKKYTATYLGALFGYIRYSYPTFRLMDFKPDQIGADHHIVSAIRKKYGTNIHGFELAHEVPELYVAQVQGILEAASEQFFGKPIRITFAVPQAETTADILCAKDIIHRAYDAGEGKYDNTIGLNLAPTIETLKGMQNISELANASASYSQGYKSASILIGSTDLTQDLTGLHRTDDKGIQEWVNNNQACGSPFRTLFPQLWDAVNTVVALRQDKSFANLDFRICGEHTTNPTFIAGCRSLRAEMCVPAKPIWMKGLPNVERVRCIQDALRNGAPLHDPHF